MSENYKITKEIALRIVELKSNDGLSSSKISEKLKTEFENFDISRISINRFYANYLKGTSKILPANAVNIEIKKTISNNSNAIKRDKSVNTDSPVVKKQTSVQTEQDSILDQLSDKKSLSRAEKPSDDLMGLYNPKD